MKAFEQLQRMIKIFCKIITVTFPLFFLGQCSDIKYDANTMCFKVFASNDEIIYNHGFTEYLITKYESGEIKYYTSLKESKEDTIKKHIILGPDYKKQCRYAIVYELIEKSHQKVSLKLMIKKKGTDNRYNLPFMNLGRFSYTYHTKEDLKKWLQNHLAKATYKCCLDLKPSEIE